ncbi:MAG: PsbP-related protein [Candidatus Peregrinibacteria bacterium]|nr:PsbP-related protein [Candidatus Peregrinibacteria bacterium]
MKFKHLVTIIISLTFTFLFTGCSGSSSTSTTTPTIKEGNTVYENNTFSLQLPKSWEVIDKTSFTSTVPTETVIGFRNNIKSDIFTANVNVAQKQLQQSDSPSVKDFAKSSLEILRNNLISYQIFNEKEGKMTYGKDGLVTYYTELEGKKSASEQIIHFKQVYVINQGIAYTVTAAYLPNEDESVVTTVGEMLDSFYLK